MITRACQTFVVAACLLCSGSRTRKWHGPSSTARSPTQRAVYSSVRLWSRPMWRPTSSRSRPPPTPASMSFRTWRAASTGFRCRRPDSDPAAASDVTLARGADADARLQARSGCHHRDREHLGAGDRDQHRGDRALRLDERVPDVAGRRGRRPAADPAVHLLEPAGDHRGHVRGGHQRRPQLLARDPDRRHPARPQPAGGQQQRDVAADRGGFGVQAADRHARGRVRRRPDGGRELRGQVRHERLPRVRSGLPDGCRLGRQTLRGQGAQPGDPGAGPAELGRRRGRADHAAETVQRKGPQLLLRDLRADAR